MCARIVLLAVVASQIEQHTHTLRHAVAILQVGEYQGAYKVRPLETDSSSACGGLPLTTLLTVSCQ